MLLLPTVGAVVLGATYAAGGWSDHRAWAQIQPAAEASGQLTRFRAEVVAERVATSTVATAHDLGVSASDLAATTGVDFGHAMQQARRILDADPTLHAYPELAGDVARLDQLRRDVDTGRASFAAADAVFLSISADIDTLWLARLDDIRRDAGRIGGRSATVDARVEIMRLTYEALRASIDRIGYANAVLRGQPTPANLTVLIGANSRYATALSDIRGRYGPKAAAAWSTLQTDPATVRFEAVLAQAVDVGLTGAPSPFATDANAYGPVVADASAWGADLTALAVAASTDAHDLAAHQDAVATRQFLAALTAAAVVLTAAVAGAALAARSITRPLKRLAAAATDITRGQFAAPTVPIAGPREVAQTAEAVNDMRAALAAVDALTNTLAHDPGSGAADEPLPGRTGQALQSGADQLRDSITAAEQHRARLRESATHDRLTGLLNRGGALDAISRDLARTRRGHTPMTVLFIDLDGLKHLNDTYGHAAGDDAITLAAQTLRATTRAADILARLGGDEFLVSTTGQNPGDTETLAERIRKAIGQTTVTVESGPIPLACSIGVAHAQHDDTVESLIHRADQALYAAKHHGRNRVVTYRPDEATVLSR